MDQDNSGLMQPQGPKRNYRVSILVVLALIALVEFILLMNKNAAPGAVTSMRQPDGEQSKPDEMKQAGSFTVSVDSQQRFSVGQPVSIVVTADSGEQSVVGFDAVVLFDTTGLTYRSVTSNLTGFTTVGSVRKGYLELTSAIDPVATAAPVLRKTSVAAITFMPKKAGTYRFTLLDQIDQSSTKFVDNKTVLYRPKLNEVVITVK